MITTQTVPPTDKARDYAFSLLDTRRLTASPRFIDATNAMDAQELAAFVQSIKDRCAADKRYCSSIIDAVKVLPKNEGAQAASAPALPDVPEGRYAVEAEDGHLAFYVVDKPAEGQWAGWTFLSVMASDEKHAIKNRATKAAILAKIAVDPKAAMLRFGQEIGKCGHCGRTLTDETSRELGIGPVCRDNLGW